MSAPEPSADEAHAGSRWHRFTEALTAPVFVQRSFLLLGFAALLVGGVNAVRAEASTTLLIVGAVLLLAGFVLGPELRELRLRHGETELFAWYRPAVQDALATSSTPEELLERVEQLETAAKAAEEAEAVQEFARSLMEAATEGARRADEALEPGEAKAEAMVLGNRVSLMLSERSGSAVGLMLFHSTECFVTDPKGRQTSVIAPAMRGTIPAVTRFSLMYPDAFPDAPPLGEGTYTVGWRRRPLIPTIAAALSPRSIIAETSFTVDHDADREQDSPKSPETEPPAGSADRSG